jgi:CheY-like chemotaxis protein
MKTILLVEDEPGIAEMLVIVLEIERYKVVAVANGVEALEALKAQKPDLILTDVMMPLMGGPELCQLVRADPSLADIPIIFQTSVEEWAVRERFNDFDAFFVKPYEVKGFLACIARLMADGREPRMQRPPAPDVPEAAGEAGASTSSPAASEDNPGDEPLKFLQGVLPPAPG